MTKILNINSEIPSGPYKGKKVNDILSSNKKDIFKLLKEGLLFDDEVLSIAGIKKNIRDVKVEQILVEHEKDTKVYEKETTSLSKILKEIRTIDNVSESDENSNSQSSDDDNDESEDGYFEIDTDFL